MVTHHIYHADLDSEMLISSHKFNQIFGTTAYRWFDKIARRLYPDAIKRRDMTVAGYHYTLSDGTVLETR